MLSRASIRHHSRRGAVVILVAISMIAILAIVAIAVDGGLLLDKRRHVQATADAAALAAADVLFNRYTTYYGLDADGSARAQALATAAANGYANDGSISIVSITFSPDVYKDGPDKGKVIPAGYVEVILQHNQKRHFSVIFSSAAVPVRARAVARASWTRYKNGILVLDLELKGALNAHGTGKVNVSGAPVIVNSSHTEAAITNGLGTLSAPEFDVAGGYSGTG